MPTSPTRAERLLTLLGAVGLVAAGAVLALTPEAPPTKGPGAPPTLPALLLFAPGLLLVAGSVRTVASGWQRRSWALASGVVAEARALGGPYVYVRCRYVVTGAEHEVEDVRVGLRREARFEEGAAVVVRYDPSAPSRAALGPALRPASAVALAAGVVAVGVSVSMLAPV